MSAAAPSPAPADRQPLQRTPSHDLHVGNAARMVRFAGYDLPLRYRAGVLKEHLHTRSAASLFDVSHMGQIAIWPKLGKTDETALALERLVPSDVVELAPGRQRYALLTAANAGILDDVMIASLGTHFVVIVNAATKEADLAHLHANMPAGHSIEMLADRALVALQGPGAENAFAAHAPAIRRMRFMDVAPTAIGGISCVVSRSGYTGEDGFEISVPTERAEDLVHLLPRDEGVALAGLGARDSLRLEAGLCLYGSDIEDTTTPVEAALEWSIQKSRRTGGKRAGGFPGRRGRARPDCRQAPRRRVGLRPEGRAPIRGGAMIYGDETSARPIGRITSGGYGPSLSAPMAMGYVEEAASAAGTRLFADVRGGRHAAVIVPLPFVPHRFRRN